MREGWKYKKLGEVCKFLQGMQVPVEDQSEIQREGQVRFLRIVDFTQGNEPPRYVNNTDLSKKCFLSVNEIAIVRYGTPGFVCRGLSGIIANNLFKIVPKIEISQLYLFYYLKSDAFQAPIRTTQYGVTMKAIKFGTIEKLILPVPPLSTQQQIVSELDLLSHILDQKRQQLKEYDALAESIFYDMFGDPVENPKGWEVVKLEQIVDVRDGTHDSPKYLNYSDYILITSKNIVNGELSFENINYISKEDFDNINKRSFVEDGDIIMAMIGTIGKPIIVKKTKDFCVKNVALFKFAKADKVINIFIKTLFDIPSYLDYLKSLNKGGTQKFVALGTLRKLNIPLPPLSLQQSFASKIEAIEKQKQMLKESIKETETLFQSRMDYWFNA